MKQGRNIAFILFDGLKMLDVTGPAEVFAEANRLGGDYTLSYVSASGRPVTTSVGIELAVSGTIQTTPTPDTLVVAGGDCLITDPIPADLVDAVRDLYPRVRRVVSICTGSFVLAAAGALTGRRATTHWRHTRLLQRAYPDVEVRADDLFVEDDGVFTSAGVSAGIDLALALLEQDQGPDLARAVARNLVVFMQRPGGQSQFSAPLDAQRPRTPALRSVVDLISAQPALDHSTSTLANRVGVSARHLSRLFATELDTTPAKYVEQVRLDHAKTLLDRGCNVSETARSAGFGSVESMRRSFMARMGTLPSHYRSRFATTQTHVQRAATVLETRE